MQTLEKDVSLKYSFYYRFSSEFKNLRYFKKYFHKKLRNLNSLTEGLMFRKSFSKAVMDPSKTFVNQIFSYNSYLTTGTKLMNSSV